VVEVCGGLSMQSFCMYCKHNRNAPPSSPQPPAPCHTPKNPHATQHAAPDSPHLHKQAARQHVGDRDQPHEVVDVRLDAARDAGVLDLHRHAAAVLEHGRVHLADAGGGAGRPLKLCRGGGVAMVVLLWLVVGTDDRVQGLASSGEQGCTMHA